MSAFSSKDRVFLFDMDGTITPARKLIENDMILFLRELTEHAYVGIVSGSPYSYIFEQLTPVFKEKKEMLSDAKCTKRRDLFRKARIKNSEWSFDTYLRFLARVQSVFTQAEESVLKSPKTNFKL